MKDTSVTYGPKTIEYYGKPAQITATVRYDDECHNGHKTFAITGEITQRGLFQAGGCLHEEIAQAFPELSPYIKWHLTSEDGPLHYIANTVYWAKEGNLNFARKSAVWPEATEDDLSPAFLAHDLRERLPALLQDFRHDLKTLGFKP